MLVLDVPVAPDQQAPTMMMVVADNRATSREITVEPGKGAIGVCRYVPKVNVDEVLNARYALSPATYLHDLLMNGYEVGGLAEKLDLNSAVVTVLQLPKHGSLGAQPKYIYQPNNGYVGNDKVTFQVEGQDLIDGQPMKYNLDFFIKVIPESKIDSSNVEILNEKYCPEVNWRISTTDNTLSAVLSNASLSFTGFADLAGGAVGQTVGTAITLDINAAGHNWSRRPRMVW